MPNFCLIFLSGLLVLSLGACAKKEEAREPAAVESSEEAGERVEEGFSHVQMEGEKAILKVEGASVSGLDSEEVTIKNPRVERFFYEEGEENSVEVEARTGIWNKKNDQVQMEGEVQGVVKFEEEIVIEHADKVTYDPATLLLILSGRVKIRQARSILNADEVIIYLDEEGKEIVKITAEGEVTGRIFPEELKKIN